MGDPSLSLGRWSRIGRSWRGGSVADPDEGPASSAGALLPADDEVEDAGAMEPPRTGLDPPHLPVRGEGRQGPPGAVGRPWRSPRPRAGSTSSATTAAGLSPVRQHRPDPGDPDPARGRAPGCPRRPSPRPGRHTVSSWHLLRHSYRCSDRTTVRRRVRQPGQPRVRSPLRCRHDDRAHRRPPERPAGPEFPARRARRGRPGPGPRRRRPTAAQAAEQLGVTVDQIANSSSSPRTPSPARHPSRCSSLPRWAPRRHRRPRRAARPAPGRPRDAEWVRSAPASPSAGRAGRPPPPVAYCRRHRPGGIRRGLGGGRPPACRLPDLHPSCCGSPRASHTPWTNLRQAGVTTSLHWVGTPDPAPLLDTSQRP